MVLKSAFAGHLVGLLLALSLLLDIPISRSSGAVSPGRISTLSRDELLRLDMEVSQFYIDSYADLDRRNTTFEEQLYRAIRAVRHTSIVNHFDYRYTNNETKWKSMGSRVERELCKYQLDALVGFVNSTTIKTTRFSSGALPLSAFDFLSASGHTGSGVLNGNFVWSGSAASCEHARIRADIVAQFRAKRGRDEAGPKPRSGPPPGDADIVGRYCVVHLRAKSWPKWDIYFEDRITVKRGLCLPQSCHSALHDDDPNIRRQIGILAMANLAPPFSDPGRFEASHLYCLPDEDSEYRRLDLGAKLFIVFVIFWMLVTLWANIKYAQRRHTMRQLRDTVDIRMIINDAESQDADSELEPNGERRLEQEANRSQTDEPDAAGSRQAERKEGDCNLLGAGPCSGRPSEPATPLPSDIEDGDSDVNLIEPFKASGGARRAPPSYALKGGLARQEARTKRPTAEARNPSPDADPLVDFVKSLSIEANLSYLFFRPRPNYVHTEHDDAGPRAKRKQKRSMGSGRLLPSATVKRRSSSSNEALVKDLQESGEHESNVAIVSGAEGRADGADVRGRRVNIEILDGLKVIATSYIVYGHTMMFFFGCVNDLRFGVERMFDTTMIATINTLQIVGLFYIITGCLLTYFSFSKTKLKQLHSPLFWLLVLVGRYLRLIPAYALVFWFARHVAPYTGSGRDWYDYRTDGDHARGACAQESWWVMWTMSAADIKIPNDCVPQAWYLSDDFRTLMVLPVYVFLMARSARLGYAAIFATFAASLWKLVHVLKAANIDYKILLNWHPHVYALMTDRLHDVYTDFLVRISTYLMGVTAGHLLYLYEIRYIRHWPSWLSRYGMKLALLTAACFFFGAPLMASSAINQFLPHRDQLDSDSVVWLIPLFKSSMELAICVILLLLVTGGGNRLIRRLLASQTMKVLSNISYAVFLSHIELMYKMPASQYESNYWYLFLYSCFYIAISHVLAFFLHLLWEMPINNLTRNLFKRAFRAIS